MDSLLKERGGLGVVERHLGLTFPSSLISNSKVALSIVGILDRCQKIPLGLINCLISRDKKDYTFRHPKAIASSTQACSQILDARRRSSPIRSHFPRAIYTK